jgi:hypothetical protein
MSLYGVYDAVTDRWSGLVGELHEGEHARTHKSVRMCAERADLAIGALSANQERTKTIDFSIPWLYHGIYIMEKTVKRLVMCCTTLLKQNLPIDDHRLIVVTLVSRCPLSYTLCFIANESGR